MAITWGVVAWSATCCYKVTVVVVLLGSTILSSYFGLSLCSHSEHTRLPWPRWKSTFIAFTLGMADLVLTKRLQRYGFWNLLIWPPLVSSFSFFIISHFSFHVTSLEMWPAGWPPGMHTWIKNWSCLPQVKSYIRLTAFFSSIWLICTVKVGLTFGSLF